MALNVGADYHIKDHIRFVSMLRESLYLLSPALYTITDDEFKEE